MTTCRVWRYKIWSVATTLSALSEIGEGGAVGDGCGDKYLKLIIMFNSAVPEDGAVFHLLFNFNKFQGSEEFKEE